MNYLLRTPAWSSTRKYELLRVVGGESDEIIYYTSEMSVRTFASTRKRAHHEECATTHPLRGDGPHEPVLRQGLQQTHSCRYLSTVHAQGASVLNIWNLK